MGPDKLTLEIAIKTTLEGAGFKPTEAEVKALTQQLDAATASGTQLNTSAEDLSKRLEQLRSSAGAAGKDVKPVTQSAEQMAAAFAEANAKGGEFGATIQKLNNEQLLAIEEKLHADIKATEALGQSTDDLKRKLQETYNTRTAGLEQSLSGTGNAAKSAAGSVGTLTQQLGPLKTAAGGATQVMNGLSQGGIGGLVSAGRGAITVVTTLATSAIGSVLIPALALAGAGFLAMAKIVNSNRETIQKWADDSKASADRVKTGVAEVEAAAAKSLETQSKKVAELTQRYNELSGAIDKSRQRVDAINAANTEKQLAEIDAREAEALEKAPTEQAKAGVTKKFAADRDAVRNAAATTDLANKELGAKLDKSTAQDTISEAQSIIDQAQLAAKKAADEFADAVNQVKDFAAQGGDAHSGFGSELREAAKIAKAAADKAAENLTQITAEQEAVKKAAQSKIDEANTTLDLAKIAREKLGYERRSAASAKRVAEAKELEARVAEQVAKGVPEAVARAREKPNSGGVVGTADGAKTVQGGPKVTEQEKAANAAIAAAEKPAPLEITPTFKVPALRSTPKITNATGDEVQSAKTGQAPLKTIRTAPVSTPAVSPEIGEAAIDPALDQFFGSTPAAPAPSAPAPGAPAQPDISAVVQPGLDQIASAVNNQPKAEAINVTPIVAAIEQVGQTTERVVAANQQATAAVQTALKAAVQRIAALERGLQATREAVQS